MPCSDSLSQSRYHEELWKKRYGNYAHMLCQACKFLTQEQLKSIRHPDAQCTLYEWYSEHVKDDSSIGIL